MKIQQIINLQSPKKNNRPEVNGRIYATDENGERLYRLVSDSIARFDGEGTLIDEDFKIAQGLSRTMIEEKIRERVVSLGRG